MTVADLRLAANVKALAWVPQNDLLGDGRLAAFVTHGGINSIYEAAYHGVPVAGIPIFGDQPDNVAKAVSSERERERVFFFFLLFRRCGETKKKNKLTLVLKKQNKKSKRSPEAGASCSLCAGSPPRGSPRRCAR